MRWIKIETDLAWRFTRQIDNPKCTRNQVPFFGRHIDDEGRKLGNLGLGRSNSSAIPLPKCFGVADMVAISQHDRRNRF